MLTNLQNKDNRPSVLCDVIEDSVARLLVLQPLADEDARGGGVEAAAAQHAVAVPHPILEGSVVNFAAGVPASRTEEVRLPSHKAETPDPVFQSAICLRT